MKSRRVSTNLSVYILLNIIQSEKSVLLKI